MNEFSFMKHYKTVELSQNFTPLCRFQTFEEYLFNRILYIRNVLNNQDDYTDTPDHDSLICELWRLLGEYQTIVGKKLADDEKED